MKYLEYRPDAITLVEAPDAWGHALDMPPHRTTLADRAEVAEWLGVDQCYCEGTPDGWPTTGPDWIRQVYEDFGLNYPDHYWEWVEPVA